MGEAGSGKTHLLCHAAESRAEAGLPVVLLHGGHFHDDEPWGQVCRQLGLDCTPDEFLGALEASAQAVDGKSLMILGRTEFAVATGWRIPICA